MCVLKELLDAKQDNCRWIEGEGDERKLCDKEIFKGSYCKAHADRVYYTHSKD